MGTAADASAALSVEAHLNYVKSSLADLRKAQRNEAVAQKRFEHEQARNPTGRVL